MKVSALFAGIGGIELGLHESDFETVLMCENNDPAVAVLEHRFPGVPVHRDVSDLTDLPSDTELVTAGFPCQDLSQAGQTGGIRGDKSGLVTHLFRLLKSSDVPWVLIENVPFMLQLDRGEAMEVLVTELERLGYNWAYRVLDSRAFGVPQRRRRVFLLASKEEKPEGLLFSEEAGPPAPLPHEGRACGFYWTEGTRGLGWAVDATPTVKGGSGLGIPSPPAIWFPNGQIVTPDIRDAERLQGFDEDWTIAAADISRGRHRWKLVGNAVSVPAAAWVGRALSQGEPGTIEAPALARKRSWPTAAFGSREGRFQVDFSEWPVRVATDSLEEFLRYPGKPLSERATAGFLRRLKASSLRYPPEFGESLERHLESWRAHAPAP